MKTFSRHIVVLFLFVVIALGGSFPALDLATPVSAQAGRSYRIVSVDGVAGTFVFFILELNSLGDETGFTTSLNFNPNILSISGVSGINTNPDVSLGADSPAGTWLTVNATQVANGRIGVFLSSPTPFTAGTRSAIVFKFFVNSGAQPGVTSLTFGDQPIGRSTSASGQGVSAMYTDGSLTILAPGATSVEGDINRAVNGVAGPGNGVVDNVDLFWYGQFAMGQHCPEDTTTNEFQRLDGNDSGGIDAGDYTYIFNRWIALAPVEAAKGPASRPVGLCDGVPPMPSEVSGKSYADLNSPTAPTSVRVVPASGVPGSTVLVPIGFEAQGIELSTGFSLSFDPNVLEISSVSGFNNPDVMKGAGGTANQRIGVNASSVANGRIGLGIDFSGGSSPALPISSGDKEIAVLRFTIKSGVPLGTETEITFTSSPVSAQTVSMTGTVITGVSYTPGKVMIGQATASDVTVGGKVMTANGGGLRLATVVLTDTATGVTRSVITNGVGFYEFADVPAGKTYTLAASSKRFRFQQKTLTNLSADLTNADFTGIE